MNAVIYCYSNTEPVHTDISGFIRFMYRRIQPRHPVQIVIWLAKHAFWADYGQPFGNLVREGLPTIHSETHFIWGKDQAFPKSMRDNVNMQPWPDRRLLDLLKLEIPIIQAPMAGSDSVALARSVSSTGALGSLACALLSPDEVREAVRALRNEMIRPFNLNFFCHTMEAPDTAATEKWKRFLRPHYERLGLDIKSIAESRLRLPFNDEMCAVVEEVRPEVVSFHFGLPTPNLLERLKRHGIKILSSATSVREAKWLASRGCDAIIAQGIEAGGHRGMFLETNIATQLGLFALLPQVKDAVSVPVIAAGGIADARGVVAALALGASGVQLGTAYLFCPEANVSPLYRRALAQAADDGTALTNLFSGRPARGILNRYLQE